MLGVLCVCWTATTLTLGRYLARLRFRPVAVIGSVVLVAGIVALLGIAAGQTILWVSVCCVAVGAGLALVGAVSFLIQPGRLGLGGAEA